MLKTLIPAYGRIYGTFEQLKEDIEAGKDFFSVTDRAYCSVRDFAEMERDAAFVGEKLNFKMCADRSQNHFWFVFGA
jgi:hypothetical protein